MSEFTVKQARLMSGKSQEIIAESLKIHRQTYAKLEQNPEKFTIEQANTFSAEVNIPYDKIKFFSSKILHKVE